MTHENEPVTPYQLPVLRQELSASVSKDIEEKGPERFIDDTLDSLDTNNPTLRNAILGFARSYDEDRQAAVIAGAMMTHELLRRQAEADSFQAQFSQE